MHPSPSAESAGPFLPSRRVCIARPPGGVLTSAGPADQAAAPRARARDVARSLVGPPPATRRSRRRAATEEEHRMSALPLAAAVADSLAYLRSPAAAASIARDPYWPKWHAPWWHVLALEDAGRLDAVPEATLRALMERAREHFVPFFPRDAAELPPGKDLWLHVVCHCALATLLRLLLARGLDGEAGIPWARGWYARYRLPDGGFNCDEQAYAKREPRSSLSSTVPPLEYLLALGDRRPLGAEEQDLLDRGAAYLLAHRLVC